ncbi:MAG: extracellular solute-binding protein [Butyrivibrio sp.]|nr:extracellular solute-binding protein [Butyrivibrio sp.]
MKKKILGTILAGTILVSGLITGCGNTKEASGSVAKAENNTEANSETTVEKGDKEAEEEKAVTLTIAARGGSHTDIINAVKGEFEQENNCTIEVLGLEGADLKQKVALDAANKEGSYDIVMIDDPVMPEFTEAGVLCNLTEMGYVDDADFVENSLALGKNPYATGDTYALPFSGNVQLMFYNQEVLDSLGAEVPDSWDDVLNISTQAHESGLYGYVIRGQQGNPIVSDYLPLLWAFGGDVFDDEGNVTVDSEAGQKSLEMYMNLYGTGENFEKDDLVSVVSEGKGAMALGWPSWFISGKDATANYAAIPSKVSDGSEEYSTGEIGNWMMGIPDNSMNKDLALKLLIYLTSADVQKNAVEIGGVPTRTSVFTDESIVANYPYFTTIYQGTENSKVRPRTSKWSAIEEAYGLELSNVVAGTKDIHTALSDAKAAIEQIMEQ